MEIPENHLTSVPIGTIILDLKTDYLYKKVSPSEWKDMAVDFWRDNWFIINESERYQIVQPALKFKQEKDN